MSSKQESVFFPMDLVQDNQTIQNQTINDQSLFFVHSFSSKLQQQDLEVCQYPFHLLSDESNNNDHTDSMGINFSKNGQTDSQEEIALYPSYHFLDDNKQEKDIVENDEICFFDTIYNSFETKDNIGHNKTAELYILPENRLFEFGDVATELSYFDQIADLFGVDCNNTLSE